MKKIKVCYSETQNLGDLLNKLVIEDVIGYSIVHSDSLRCQSTGIGSGLPRFFIPESQLKKSPKSIARRVLGRVVPPVQIWSAGFIRYSNDPEYSLRRVNVASVRGEITRSRLEKILNRKLDVPTGDGGLLASLLLKKQPEKKYQVGIIPHMREKGEARIIELTEKYQRSVLIDITADPLDVLKTISQCEFILSSSLHGLIVADSFGIPNKRLVYTNNLVGDGYKFDDYYSSFNVKSNSASYKEGEFPTINSIIDDYLISKKQVEKKQEEIIASFSRFL
ncbi:polysaccharide pyruvyl transferase family protein [Robertmurraya massiliosenegalensis]|uniref:polysaccharide pyruvyl transferase family protein n=1 Tax=Robertmurraya TaxID=2837507 RepID=UPI0039A4DCB8